MKKYIYSGYSSHPLMILILFSLALCPFAVQAAEWENASEEALPTSSSTGQYAFLDNSRDVSAAQQDGRGDDLRLRLAQVSLFAETGKLDRAFELIQDLKREYPNNTRVLSAEADLNFNIGNYSSAFAGLNKAILLDPSDEDIMEQQRAAVYSQGPNLLGGYAYRRTDLAYEQLSRITAHIPVSQTITAMLNVENDHLHSRTPIIRDNGSSRHFRGDEQRGTLMVNKVLENSDEINGSVFANTFTAGVGAQYSLWDYSGVTRVKGEFNRPDWDYIEMVVEGGTRSDLHIERKQVFTKDFNVTFGGGFNHYALDEVWDAADALAWNANAEYTIPVDFFGGPKNEMNLTAAYTADAEYFTFVKRRTSTAGIFKPLSASDYEIHAGTLSATKKFFTDFSVQAYGGYSVNRLNNNHGPLYGGNLEYSLSNRLGIELRASHTDSGGQNNAQKEDQFGLNLKWIL